MYTYTTFSKRKNTFFSVLGIIVMCLTLGIGFFLFYSNFFERELYINRKKLYKYLLKNQLTGNGNSWTIGKYELIYFKDDNDFALFNGNECLICSFHLGILDSYYYNKILKMVKT